jgi:hypothetical protein
MICSQCRKLDALDTRWNKFKHWLMFKLFSRDIADEKASSFTQGFGDGYKMGRQHQAELQERNNIFANGDLKENKTSHKKNSP